MRPDDLLRATSIRPVQVGRYDVIGLLGEGGMGAVFDAVDREHGTHVALKTLTHLGPESLLRFKKEFRSSADLSHPNLVSLFELSCQDDLWFFTMERVDGVDFLEWLRGGQPAKKGTAEDTPTRTVASRPLGASRGATPVDLTDPRAAPETIDAAIPVASLPPDMPKLRAAFAQLVRGVRALHVAGLLHLDLKPSNVLVDRNGRVVVLDFGLVRSTQRDPLDPTGSLIGGSPAWMAPEQHFGENVGEAADWFAIGLMLYAALTGVPAIAHASRRVLLSAPRYVRPLPPAALLPGIPADLSWLADILIDPEPARRPPGSMIAELAAGQGASAAPVGRSGRRELVGREPERARLTDALRAVRAGGAAVVHLSGPSGVGKSALLGSLLDEARSSGDALVLRGRCYERESVPYKAFDEILDALAVQLSARPELLPKLPVWIRELARVFPVLARVPAIADRVTQDSTTSALRLTELRRRAVEALREVLTALAARRPLILAVDDLQWADADSVTLLMRLVEAPAPGGLLLAVSFRPEAADSADVAAYFAVARTFVGREDLRYVGIDVGPLAAGEAERLAGINLAAVNVREDGLAAAIAKEAAGVPFFIEALADDVAEQRAAGRAPTPAGVTLEKVLARRVQSLASGERALVEVLAVAGSPIPLSTAFAAAGVDSGHGRRALWSLSTGRIVNSTGPSSDDGVELHHDRIRQAVLGSLTTTRIEDCQLALGRVFAVSGTDGTPGEWLFDAVRHLNSAAHRLRGPERLAAARLNLAAGRRAHRTAAFPLAFDCFVAGKKQLEADAWETEYELALGLHQGAAETAYLCGAWPELGSYVAVLKARGRTLFDQLPGWEAQIDGCIARNEYSASLDVAIEVLRLLGVELPPNPGEAEVGTEVGAAMAALARIGPEGLSALPVADDPVAQAAMRIQTRVSSAAYFARPMLLPLIACRLVVTSVERGLSPATPYALSIYGIVLNTIGMHRDAHRWGQLALALIERFEDRSLEARTRHVVNDLVCTWTVPLGGSLDALRDVVRIGRATGDLEYAAYAAHAYVHNAFYASRPLEELFEEALAFGAFMRGYQQVNALHVHEPFEQIIRCFTRRAADPASLNGDGFEEAVALEGARSVGSRSAQCLVQLLMGIVRYHFGTASEASACFERARPFLDGVASTWHVPMFHQYAALAIHGLAPAERNALLAPAEASLAALRTLAAECPENFAHRVALIEGERARADGDLAVAAAQFEAAIRGAGQGGWTSDLGLAHELAARCKSGVEADGHRQAAREAYGRWGAKAKVSRLA